VGLILTYLLPVCGGGKEAWESPSFWFLSHIGISRIAKISQFLLVSYRNRPRSYNTKMWYHTMVWYLSAICQGTAGTSTQFGIKWHIKSNGVWYHKQLTYLMILRSQIIVWLLRSQVPDNNHLRDKRRTAPQKRRHKTYPLPAKV
jgi:hypothetical protein